MWAEKRGKNLKKKSEESRKQAKKLKKKKTNGESDEELMEESDDLDEGEEVDYISGSSRSRHTWLLCGWHYIGT